MQLNVYGRKAPVHTPPLFKNKARPIHLDVMDLDSSLTSSAAEEKLEQAIVEEMATHYPDKTLAEVDAINKMAYREHGCSFLFMEDTFGIERDEFIRKVYTRFHKSHGHMYTPNKRLKSALARSQRPKMIFTASPIFHAKFVLEKMGIFDEFERIEAADGALIGGRKKYAVSVLRDLRLYIADVFKTSPRHMAIYDDKSAVLDAAEEQGFAHRIQVRDRTASFHQPVTAGATLQVKSVATALGQLKN